jgi:hypothetical protein
VTAYGGGKLVVEESKGERVTGNSPRCRASYSSGVIITTVAESSGQELLLLFSCVSVSGTVHPGPVLYEGSEGSIPLYSGSSSAHADKSSESRVPSRRPPLPISGPRVRPDLLVRRLLLLLLLLFAPLEGDDEAPGTGEGGEGGPRIPSRGMPFLGRKNARKEGDV